MNAEDKLKEYILKNYRSIREFTQEIDMPYSTMATILKKGIENATVQNLIKICQALNISTDELIEGRIVTTTKTADTTKIEDILNEAKQKLMESDYLTIEGNPATAEDIYLIISTLDTVMEIRKMQSKRLAEYYKQLSKG